MGWSKVAILIVKPLDILKQAIGKNVIVVLKGKREYRGVLDGYDPHMNLVLKNAEELVSGESVGRTATIIVRGDNVIYISP
ncbi:like-Sm ribonucleoprotein core [Methanoculleus sp. CAG:1088]|jgi:small nuclear ribonucleoprotein|uniref:Putative snRNP Sm-like protein n=1 Tax=Methanomethylophilus alvi TaxID=1291540 RepID=A0A3G3II01_9ARCH|nr:small nuclear ribonucleoprotein [Methanomethylophilus alvi]CDF30230.1 like-Sm ribonucleoprotein core [Methanoculleus sp. CAG:1088]